MKLGLIRGRQSQALNQYRMFEVHRVDLNTAGSYKHVLVIGHTDSGLVFQFLRSNFTTMFSIKMDLDLHEFLEVRYIYNSRSYGEHKIGREKKWVKLYGNGDVLIGDHQNFIYFKILKKFALTVFSGDVEYAKSKPLVSFNETTDID